MNITIGGQLILSHAAWTTVVLIQHAGRIGIGLKLVTGWAICLYIL